MSLPTIDMNKIRIAQEKDWLRQLESYIRKNMIKTLRVRPGDMNNLSVFINAALQRAREYELSHKGASQYILASVLLGIDWNLDPKFRHVMAIINNKEVAKSLSQEYFVPLAVKEKRIMDACREALAGQLANLNDEPIETFWRRCARIRFARDAADYDYLWPYYLHRFRGIYLDKSPESVAGLSKTPLRQYAASYTEPQRERLRLHLLMALYFGCFYYRDPLLSQLSQEMKAITPDRQQLSKFILGEIAR